MTQLLAQVTVEASAEVTKAPTNPQVDVTDETKE